MLSMKECRICPRNCGVDRTSSRGYCGMGENLVVAHAMLHAWEEPPISGECGSGTVFFSGCNLRCCYCQNATISFAESGRTLSISQLAELFLRLQAGKAHNINLITPTHFVPLIVEALHQVKRYLNIPVIYNTSAYEKVETLKMLEGYVDIYLPDLKYFSHKLALQYSHAEDYFPVATEVILEMYRQVGDIVMGEDGILQSGMLIRHMILPGAYQDSIRVLQWIAENFSYDEALLSIMSQYTPQGASEYPNLNRRIYTMELQKVIQEVQRLQFRGFVQERTSAQTCYTPVFLSESIDHL